MSEPAGAEIRKLDSGNRFTVPDAFLENYPRKLVLCPGFDNSVRAYSTKQWDDFDVVLRELNPNDPDDGDILRFFRALTTTVTLDSNNRFRFTEALMNWAKIDDEHRDVQVYDAGEYLEFWEVGTWDRFMTEKSASMKELARRVFDRDKRSPRTVSDGAGSPAGDAA